jgi:hypothetical protein
VDGECVASCPAAVKWCLFRPVACGVGCSCARTADGTYTGISPYGGTGMGVWRPTGERSVELTIFFFDLDPDPSVVAMGTVVNTNAFTVSDDGMSFSGPYSVEGHAPDGTVVFAFRDRAANWEGTRLDVMPMLPVGMTEAGTPTP